MNNTLIIFYKYKDASDRHLKVVTTDAWTEAV